MNIDGQDQYNKGEEDLDLKIGQRQYGALIQSIEQDPFAQEIWEDVIARARAEETSGQNDGFYAQFDLDELIAVGARIRSAKTQEDKYRILTERTRGDELWYDIVLGHVNDKNIPPFLDAIHSRKSKWDSALDAGSGPGNVLRALAPLCKEITGIDQLDFFNDISRAHPVFPTNATLVNGDACSLDTVFSKDAFDIVVSNGLTRYFDGNAMERFIHALGIVVRPGGSYFESFIIHDSSKELVPKSEEEYLSCAKGILVLLLDRIVSHVSHEKEISIQVLVQRFQEAGFIISSHPPTPENICIIEFQKSL